MIKERNKFLLSILIIFALFFVYFKINENVLKKELEKSSKFTIGRINEIIIPGRGTTIVKIHFFYKKKKICIQVGLGVEIKDSHKVKDRIFIQFSPKHPDEYFLCFDVPKVPHDLNAPENGWDHLPVKKIILFTPRARDSSKLPCSAESPLERPKRTNFNSSARRKCLPALTLSLHGYFLWFYPVHTSFW